MADRQGKRLLVSIHDVGPAFTAEVELLAERLSAQLGGRLFAMLVVPNHWHAHPIAGNRAFAARLRAWADEGVEMFVHGWSHRDCAIHRGYARFKANHLTANEGEFLGLSTAEAAKRMADGKALIEDIIGRPVAGFIAPAWLYGPGAREALRGSGFQLAEDHMRVWHPETGRILARGPVVTWASRTRLRTLSSLAFARFAQIALQPLATVRLAVHPGDVSKPSLLSSIEQASTAFASGRQVSRYASLLT